MVKGKIFCNKHSITYLCNPKTVDVVQLVRTPDCGSGGRGFESHLPPGRLPCRQPFFISVYDRCQYEIAIGNDPVVALKVNRTG